MTLDKTTHPFLTIKSIDWHILGHYSGAEKVTTTGFNRLHPERLYLTNQLGNDKEHAEKQSRCSKVFHRVAADVVTHDR